MPVTQDKPGPYAPPTPVIGIIERFRERGLPSPITAEVLIRANCITESLAPRTIYSLQTLDLIDESGNPTDTFRGLARATSAEYQAHLAEWFRNAYADILNFVDPANTTEAEVLDAFRPYSPPGQRDRMVSLFMGLARKAGLAPEKASGPGSGAPRKKNGSTAKRPRSEKPAEQAAKVRDKTDNAADDATSGVGSHHEHKKLPSDFRAALLAKFPDFDPNWSDDLKKAWFADFDLFMKMVTPS